MQLNLALCGIDSQHPNATPVVGPFRVFRSFYKGAFRLSVLCKISDRKHIAEKFRLDLKNVTDRDRDSSFS